MLHALLSINQTPIHSSLIQNLPVIEKKEDKLRTVQPRRLQCYFEALVLRTTGNFPCSDAYGAQLRLNAMGPSFNHISSLGQGDRNSSACFLRNPAHNPSQPISINSTQLNHVSTSQQYSTIHSFCFAYQAGTLLAPAVPFLDSTWQADWLPPSL